jgi:hypothetical protein
VKTQRRYDRCTCKWAGGLPAWHSQTKRLFRRADSRTVDAILAAISTTIAWGPLMRKRISRLTAETLPWYLRLYGVMIGASIPAKHHQHGSLWGISREERFGRWTMADFLFLARSILSVLGRQ